MSEAGVPGDVPKGWDPRRRAALESIWVEFRRAGAYGKDLSAELVAGRRCETAVADEPC